MNLEAKVSTLQQRVSSIINDSQEVIRQAREAAKLLSIAEDMGVTVISIGRKSALVENEGWPFGYSGSIFTKKEDQDKNGWPSAWAIASKAGVDAGAGNSGQHQVKSGVLLEGVYQLRDGQWYEVSQEES